jgi:hypothetical protein
MEAASGHRNKRLYNVTVFDWRNAVKMYKRQPGFSIWVQNYFVEGLFVNVAGVRVGR